MYLLCPDPTVRKSSPFDEGATPKTIALVVYIHSVLLFGYVCLTCVCVCVCVVPDRSVCVWCTLSSLQGTSRNLELCMSVDCVDATISSNRKQQRTVQKPLQMCTYSARHAILWLSTSLGLYITQTRVAVIYCLSNHHAKCKTHTHSHTHTQPRRGVSPRVSLPFVQTHTDAVEELCPDK